MRASTSSRVGFRSRPQPFEVALLIETSTASGRDMLRGVAQYARERGDWSLYYEPGSRTEILDRWAKSGPRGAVQGIIARLDDPKRAAALASRGVPIVDVLGGGASLGIPLVHVDHDAIARLAVTHFVERGVRSFGYFGVRNATWSRLREEAFTRALAARGATLRTCHVAHEPRGLTAWHAQGRALASFLAALEKPAGVLAAYDPSAFQVLEACRKADLVVPDEVLVLGVDNDEPLCALSAPPLSSIDANHFTVGYRAAERLDQLARARLPSPTSTLVEPLGVVVRRSTDLRAVDDPSVAAALRFIREHACEGIEVPDVVHHAGVSRSVLQRRFREKLGRTVHDEILRVRLARVQDLLAGSDLPIKVIAARAGFDHAAYLSVAFRGAFGLSPREYRRRARPLTGT